MPTSETHRSKHRGYELWRANRNSGAARNITGTWRRKEEGGQRGAADACNIS